MSLPCPDFFFPGGNLLPESQYRWPNLCNCTLQAAPGRAKASLQAGSDTQEGSAGHRVTCLISPFSDDGAIRVWKNFADLEKNPEMVTAWQGLSDMLPTTRGEFGLLLGEGSLELWEIWFQHPWAGSPQAAPFTSVPEIITHLSHPATISMETSDLSVLLSLRCGPELWSVS
jgi:hypothetical protein